MFDTKEPLLSQLLDEVRDGEIQLPDFQRGWIWDDNRIRDLLLSVARGFPIGAILRLESGSSLRFKARPVEGADVMDIEPESYLLDGQQRVTSLFQALKYPGPVDTHDARRRRIKRWYYIDMIKAVDSRADDEFVFSISETKEETSDFGRTVERNLSSRDLEYQQHMFPTERLLDSDDWLLGYVLHWEKSECRHPRESAAGFFAQFKEAVVKNVQEYRLPVIDLDKQLPREAVCLVFEKVNTGGVPLNVFELLTATLAAEGFDLRADWARRRDTIRQFGSVLHGVQSDQFLQVVALLSTYENRQRAIENGIGDETSVPSIACGKREILRLDRSEYEKWATIATSGFIKAGSFLHRQCVFRYWDIPYRTQIVPLAVLYASMGNEIEPADAQRRLEKWFWSGVFGEVYGGATEAQFARDVQHVPKFVREGGSLQILDEASFVPDRLLSLRTRNSAAYKGIHALLLKRGATDWMTDVDISVATFEEQNIDVHHIFPRSWCENRSAQLLGTKVPRRVYNSTINKTPLSARTNRMLGGRAPSRYIPSLQERFEDVETAIGRHGIDVDTLKSDDFASFFVERGKALMHLISDAMGKELPDGEDVFRNALESAHLRIETDEYDDDEEEETFIPIAAG